MQPRWSARMAEGENTTREETSRSSGAVFIEGLTKVAIRGREKVLGLWNISTS